MRVAALVASALFILAGCVPTEAPTTAAQAAPETCRVVRVIDGDTVDMSCAGAGTFRARLLGYDTPEIFSPRCAAERHLGLQAKDRLAELLRGASTLGTEMGGYDRYDRRLVRLLIDGQDVARTLVTEGLAVRYGGGVRINWCARLA